MNNKNLILNLLGDIIEHERILDNEKKKEAVSEKDWDNATGESFTLYNLKILKDLIEND
jgi:predicted nucleotidyltransferase